MMYYDCTEQAKNRLALAKRTADYLRPNFSREGLWLLSEENMGMRELMFCTSVFFITGSTDGGDSEDILLANRIIQSNIPGYRRCHFMPFTIAQCYWHFEKYLEEETKQALDTYFLTWFDKSLTPEMDFVGANDNFPCMATAAALFASQRYGREDALVIVRKRLRQLLAMAQRRDFPSEYTSATYSSISTIALAEVASHAEDDDIREMALAGEAWFWRDMLLHFHLPTAQMAGPHSRAYPIDVTAGTHHARFSYFALYGSKLPVTPLETIALPPEVSEKGCVPGMVLHHDPDFLRISAFWTLLPSYHCPASLADEALARHYPFTVEGTADCLYSRERILPDLPRPSKELEAYYENPAVENHVYTYMADRYTIGTSLRPFNDGLTSLCMHVNYIKDAPAVRQQDVKTVYVHYMVNGVGGDLNEGKFKDLGRKFGVQRENSALLLYSPRPMHNEGITSLKLTVSMSALYEMPDEVWIGRKKLDLHSGESQTCETVFVRDGHVCFAFTPMISHDGWEGTRIRVHPNNRTLDIDFINYEGAARDFDRTDLMSIGSGVGIEVRDLSDVGSFEAFRESMEIRKADFWNGKTARRAIYENGTFALGMEYCPSSQSVRWTQNARISDGKPILRWDIL